MTGTLKVWFIYLTVAIVYGLMLDHCATSYKARRDALDAARSIPLAVCHTAPAPDPLVEEVELELDQRLEGALPEDAHLVAMALVDQARVSGFDPWFVLAIIEVESQFRIESCSPSGAMGLMQVLPSTFREVSKSPRMLDPVENVRAGIRYLDRLFANGFTRPTSLLRAYNGGPGAAVAFTKAQQAGDDLSAFPDEMKQYPGKVWGRYQAILRERGEKAKPEKTWRTR